MTLTTDPNDPRLGHGSDDEPIGGQHDAYLVLSAEERARGFQRPVYRAYIHAQKLGGCGAETRMGLALSETYARDPGFYGATFCCHCDKHRPVGADGEFFWLAENGAQTGLKVGT